MKSRKFATPPRGTPKMRLRVLTHEHPDGAEVHTLQMVRGDNLIGNFTPADLAALVQDVNEWIDDQ